MTSQLNGRKILVVEDSPVVAPFAQDVLEELGCTVVGPACNMADARALAASEDIDAALVDIRIRGDKSFPICEILRGRGIPFVLTSGYADWSMPSDWADRPQLPKPYKLEDVEAALLEILPEVCRRTLPDWP
jgi:CheY-like chemotaxis protein